MSVESKTAVETESTTANTARELVQASISFLKAPSERPLKEKIEFLAKNKKLEKHQLMFALQKAGLYDSSKVGDILDDLYPDSSESQLSETFAAVQSVAPPHPYPAHPPPAPSAGAFSWISGLATGGLALMSAVGSVVASKRNAEKMIEKERTEMMKKLEEIRSELREQAELDREKQHRDLMAIVQLLQTQSNSIQETLTLLRQSNGLIESHMKMQVSQNGMLLSNVDRLSFHRPTDDDSGSQRSGRSRRSNGRRKDRRALPGSNNGMVSGGGASSEDELGTMSSELLNRRKLGPIAGLLDQKVGDKSAAYDWMNQDLDAEVAALGRGSGNDGTSAVESDSNAGSPKKKTPLGSTSAVSGYPATTDTDGDLLASAVSGSDSTDVSRPNKMDLNDEDVPCIYNPRWKTIIETCLDMDSAQYCQSELIRLLQTWQVLVHHNSLGGGPSSPSDAILDTDGGSLITVAKLKSCLNCIAFYISKIVQRPWMNNFRKINCCNKQYNERLKPVPLIEELLAVIGYERTQDGLFWMIDSPQPAPKTQAEFEAIMTANDKESKQNKDSEDAKAEQPPDFTQFIPFISQLNFLKSLDLILKSVFAFKLDPKLEVRVNQAMVKRQIAAQKAKAESLALQAKEKSMEQSKQDVSSAVGSASSVSASVIKDDADPDPSAEEPSEETSKKEDDSSLSVLDAKPSLVSSSPSCSEKQESPVPYSASFVEVLQKTQNGEKIPGIRDDIDDMPEDPNAPLSESTMTPLKKPYMNDGSSSTDDWLASIMQGSVESDAKAEESEEVRV